jgi:hypothetical protein
MGHTPRGALISHLGVASDKARAAAAAAAAVIKEQQQQQLQQPLTFPSSSSASQLHSVGRFSSFRCPPGSESAPAAEKRGALSEHRVDHPLHDAAVTT